MAFTKYERGKESKEDLTSVFNICKDMCIYSTSKSVDYDMLLRAVLARGYSEEILDLMLKNYSNLNVLMKQDNTITVMD